MFVKSSVWPTSRLTLLGDSVIPRAGFTVTEELSVTVCGGVPAEESPTVTFTVYGVLAETVGAVTWHVLLVAVHPDVTVRPSVLHE